MPIPTTCLAELTTHIRNLGIGEGDRLCVHSRLISFGRIPGGAATAYGALRDIVGASGTIAVPTYTFNLNSDSVFDPEKTPSHACGELSEYVRELPGSVRTRAAIHSYASTGPASRELLLAKEDRSFGDGSVFEVMVRHGFKLLLLGCNYTEGATFIHHVETNANVAYREWIDLDRQVRFEDGQVRKVKYKYFAKKSSAPPINDLSEMEKFVENSGTGRFATIPAHPTRRSHAVPLDELEKVAAEAFAVQSNIIVRDEANR